MADDIKVKITVDDKGLLQHLKKISAAEKQLLGVNDKLTGSTNKTEKANKKVSEALALQRRELQLVARELKDANSSYEKIGITSKTAERAFNGSRRAIVRVRKAMALMRKEAKLANRGLFDLTNGGRLLSNSFATMRSKLLLVSFGVGLVTAGLLRQVQAFAKQEESVLKVARVFGTSAAKELSAYASQLQSITRFGDENINILMSQIGAFGATKQQTKELTLATLNLAEGLGLDLNTAGLLVAKSFGSTTNALGRYGIIIDGTMSKQEKLGAITEGINSKFGDLAKLMAKTTSGQLSQASNAFGDLQERLGQALAPAVLTVANVLKFLAESIPTVALTALMNIIVSVSISFGIYKAGAMAVAAANIKAAISFKSLNAAIISTRAALIKSGWGAIVVAFGAIAGAVVTWWQSTKGLTQEQEELNKRIDKVAASMGIQTEVNKKLIQSIIDNEDAIAKKIAITEAEITLSGRALEIKLEEIRLGRELTDTEKDLMDTLNSKLQSKEKMAEADQNEIDLKNTLNQAYQSTIQGQIASLETTIFTASQKTTLNNQEIAGIKELERQLDALYEKRDADPSEEQFEKTVRAMELMWIAMEKYDSVISKSETTMKGIHKSRKNWSDDEVRANNMNNLALKEYNQSMKELRLESIRTGDDSKLNVIEWKQLLEEDVNMDKIESSLLKQRQATKGLTEVEMMLWQSRLEGAPISKKYADELLAYEAQTKKLAEAQQAQIDLESKLQSLGVSNIEQKLAEVEAEIALAEAIEFKDSVQLQGYQALLDIKAKLQEQEKNEEANEKARFMVTKKINQDKMGIVSDNFKNLAALNEASKGSAIFTATLQAIAAGIDAHKAAGSAYAQAPLGFKTAAAAAAYAAGIARVVSIYQGVSKLKSAGGEGKHKAQQGGYINGQPHSAGGTMIEAEQGEFIMSKAAVDSIGLENINAMNQSGSTGSVSVNISGNVMTKDFVEGELAESIKEAVRRGSDFGLN